MYIRKDCIKMFYYAYITYTFLYYYFQDCMNLISTTNGSKIIMKYLSYIEKASRWQILVEYALRWEKGWFITQASFFHLQTNSPSHKMTHTVLSSLSRRDIQYNDFA